MKRGACVCTRKRRGSPCAAGRPLHRPVQFLCAISVFNLQLRLVSPAVAAFIGFSFLFSLELQMPVCKIKNINYSSIGYVGPGYPRARPLGGMSMLSSRPLPTETSASNESFARGGTAPPSNEWCAARLPPLGWPANPVLEDRLSRLQPSCGRPPRMSRAPGGGRRPPRMRGAPAPLPSALSAAARDPHPSGVEAPRAGRTPPDPPRVRPPPLDGRGRRCSW